jgi:hypothetical protein
MFPPHTDDFQQPIKFKSDLGNEFFGKKGEKPSKEKPKPKESPKTKAKTKPFHVSIVGGMDTLLSFSSGGSVRRGWLERSPARPFARTIREKCSRLRIARSWSSPRMYHLNTEK